MIYRNRIRNLIGLSLSVCLSMLWIAACSPTAPTPAPTPDLNPFRTQVAATVLAQVAQSLALTPSATPFPSPTATEQPSSTTRPSPSPSPSPEVTLSSGTQQAGSDNHAQWVSQSVADDTVFAPNETFTMTWRLKNTGTSTWKTGYMLRYYSGDAFGAPKEIVLGQEVAPGVEVDITAQMKAPASPGDYLSDWVMSTDNRLNFKDPVFLKIKVIAPPTPTRTPTPKP